MSSGDKGNTIEGTRGQGGDTARQRPEDPGHADRCRGREAGIQNADPKIQGGVGQDRREFKSVNYNYLNQL